MHLERFSVFYTGESFLFRLPIFIFLTFISSPLSIQCTFGSIHYFFHSHFQLLAGQFIVNNNQVLPFKMTTITTNSQSLFSSFHFLFLASNFPCFQKRSSILSDRIFRSFFGATPSVCSILWSLLKPQERETNDPNHLLWALVFLKVYGTEEVNSSLVGTTVKTFRKWSLHMVRCISELNIVSFIF